LTGSEQPSHQSHPRHHRLRWLLVAIAVLLGLPLLLLVALFLALRSEAGTEWVIEQIPGLTVNAGRGSLFGQWQAESLHWRGYGVDLRILEPDIDWSPTCLFEKTLCLDKLHATSINLSVQSGEEQSSEPLTDLPSVALPVSLQIRDVQLGSFTYNGTSVWDQLTLKAGGSGADWQIESLRYRRNDIDLALRGRVETRGDWPVDLTLSGELPPPYGEHWSVNIALAGSIRDLRFDGSSEGYLPAQLQGRVKPLDPALPASVRVTSPQFLALDSLPETLVLNNLEVALKGSLEKGFQTRGNASLSGSEGPVALALEGLLTPTGLSGLVLSLEESQPESAPAGTVTLEGQLKWQQDLQAEGNVALRGFPWYSLIPDLDKPPVTLNSMDGTLAWNAGRYNADLEAAVEGPSGPSRLQTRVEGDLRRLLLSDLSVSSGAGSLTGSAEVGLEAPVSWDARLQLDEFDPGYWVPVLTANLNGTVKSSGQMTNEGLPDMQLRSDLEGSWREQPTTLTLAAEGGPGNWTLSELMLGIGENQLEGEGRWSQSLEGEFRFRLPEPATIYPELEGSLEGSLSVAGTPKAPLGQLQVNGQALRWGSAEADQLRLQAQLEQGLSLAAELFAEQLSAGGQELEQARLQLDGTREQHTLSLDGRHEQASLALQVAAGFKEGWSRWLGQLNEGRIELPEERMTWSLDQSASLAWQQDGPATVGAHCWRMDEASVCAGDQQLWPETRISYVIQNFPTRALTPLMPEDIRWDTRLDAELDLVLTEQGPNGKLTVDAGEGAVDVLALDGWQTLAYQTFRASARLQPEQANLELSLEGPQIGRLNGQLQIDPMAEQKDMQGSFRLEELNLALATAFTDLEQVEGTLGGEGKLSGPLMKPAVNGELVLTDGKLQDGRMPVPLEDVVATLALQGYSARLDGRWKSSDRSSGTLEGSFDWEGSPGGELALQADRLPFRYEPYARLELEPDLTIRFREGNLAVEGRVGVPRGQIEIEELPAQAVSVSEDEVIVGADGEQPVVRKLDLDIRVLVGEDRVSFAGFGVTGDLEGVLRIGDNLDTRGSLQLVDGQYEAYGQELELRRARLVFDGPVSQPYLDIEAVRRVDTVVAGIRLSGPVSSPRTEVFSEPDMPQSQALSYVILGRPLQSRGDEGQMSRAAISLGLTQTAEITRGIGEELGIRDLTLEAAGSGDESSVVASGYITDELSLRYGVGIFEPITTVALRYDLGKYFYLEAASGLAASLDIFYTRDF
jgi:translocation and assembly module TamB